MKTFILSKRPWPGGQAAWLSAVGVGMALAAWLLSAHLRDRPDAEPDLHAAAAPRVPQTRLSSPSATPPGLISSAPGVPQGPPAGVSERDWQALRGVMARLGHAPDEARRLLELVRYQRDFEAMQALDDPDDARQRRRMAERLLTELPQRVREGEFTLMESALLGSALWSELEPDDARRKARLASWYADVVATVPEAGNEVAMLRLSKDTERKRSQATAFIAWQNQGDEARRSEAGLEQALRSAQHALNAGG